LINGVSPAVGGFAVVIPFFFENPNAINDDLWVYVSCFILIALLLFFLGAYLAKISKDSILKYGIKMTLVGVLTAIITILLNLNSLFN
jgi:predicted membrane protein (TIGR00267 family)